MKWSLGPKAQLGITGDDKHERYGDSAALRSECPRTKPSAMLWSLSKPVLNILPHCFLRFVYFPSPLTPSPHPHKPSCLTPDANMMFLTLLLNSSGHARPVGFLQLVRFWYSTFWLSFQLLVSNSKWVWYVIYLYFFRQGCKPLYSQEWFWFFLVHVKLWRMLLFNICRLHLIK